MTPYYWILIKIRAMMARIFSYSGRHAKILLEFTDKEPFFAGLSVIKTHFTDKPSFFGDLSVNFWPLWWGFTDKAGFLEHLSVKPRSKRLNFYGQTAVFAHFHRFVRKRQWFCQMQCCASSAQPLHLTSVTDKRRFLRFARNLRPHGSGEGNWVEYFFNFGWFCSTFEAARPEFGGSGRQK